MILSKFYYDWDPNRRYYRIIIPDLIQYTEIKYNGKYYEDMDDHQKGWTWVQDLEKDLDKIDNYEFID